MLPQPPPRPRMCRRWSHKFPGLCESARHLPGDGFWMDGELVVMTEGRSWYGSLQEAVAHLDQSCLAYYVFDLLWLGGENLCLEPIEVRKRKLEGRVEPAVRRPHCRFRPGVLHRSVRPEGGGDRQQAAGLNLQAGPAESRLGEGEVRRVAGAQLCALGVVERQVKIWSGSILERVQYK